jgi:hypothetical protein
MQVLETVGCVLFRAADIEQIVGVHNQVWLWGLVI